MGKTASKLSETNLERNLERKNEIVKNIEEFGNYQQKIRFKNKILIYTS